VVTAFYLFAVFVLSTSCSRLLAAECRQLIASVANGYDITIYDIVHCNNFVLRDIFWQKFGCLLGFS